MKQPQAVSPSPVKPLLDEPRLIATIDTRYEYLYSISCLGEHVWVRGDNEIMKLLNLQGKVLTSMQTKSGTKPWDIAVTWDGDLVYTSIADKTVNLVKNKQIQTVITLQGWAPHNLCSTSSKDLLVTMVSADCKQSKVVRYSADFAEKQTVQFDDQGRPLFSCGRYNNFIYVEENKNLDICVADFWSRAVLVVNQSGKIRFRYTGHPNNAKASFTPRGIATDSQGRILTADFDNHLVHIIDQDGQFLRYIQNCSLVRPWGLCVDIRDNLFVGECYSANVKKIQYL
jgi:streptogramin lyase